MGALMELRKMHKDEFEQVHGVKLGFMSARQGLDGGFIETLCGVFPIDDAEGIVYRDYCDVSVAVASLQVWWYQYLETRAMSFADVEKSIQAYAMKARDGSLWEEMSGGTSTTPMGRVWFLMGTPILNPPRRPSWARDEDARRRQDGGSGAADDTRAHVRPLQIDGARRHALVRGDQDRGPGALPAGL